MTSNNQFIKQIAEIVTGDTITGTHSNNYYWTIIASKICNKTYTSTNCNGKLIKEIAEAITGKVFTGLHFNNFYYRQIALEYVESLEHTNDNYLLEVIAENINLSTTVRLSVSSDSVTYGGSIVLSATVLDEIGQPVTGETVTFKEGDTSLGTGTTNSSGVATLTISSLDIGSHTINAVYEEYSSNSVSVNITKITPSISLNAMDNSVTYGDNISLSGVLSVGSGKTVTIYDGETSLGTVTTTTDGAFSKTVTGANVGIHNYTAVYNGDSTYNNVTSSSVSVSVVKLDTSLSMTVPPTLVYSDSFNITGVLTDENNNTISNASVGLKVGNTITNTATTNQNGEVSFTESPVNMGTHTFQLVFLGDSIHEASNSSSVTRNISKETSVINVTSPSASSTSIYDDGTVTVTGTLTDNDNTPISNANVLVKEGNTTITTLTTGSNGDFTGTINGSDLNVGSHTLRIIYPENTNYTGSYIDKTVVVSGSFDGISLSSTKDILSYVDSDSCTVTCQLTSEESAVGVAGETVSFTVHKQSDDSLVETLTSQTTDSNGQCSVTYYSKGVGDLYIKASCGLLIQTYNNISDIYYGGDWTKITSDTNHWTKHTGVTGRNIYNWLSNFTDDIEIEFKFKDNIPNNWLVGLGAFTSALNQIKGLYFKNNGNTQIWWSTVSSANQNVTLSNTITTNSIFKIVTDNLHRINFYIDDTLITTKDTRSDYPVYLRIDDFTSTPMELEYLKVRKL